MTNSTPVGFLVIVLAAAQAGCDGGTVPSPTAPSAVLQQPTLPPVPVAPNRMSEVTLSGLVYEVTRAGKIPIEGVAVYCEPCGAETHTWAYTDSNGFYSFFGVWLDGVPTRLHVRKNGFVDPPGLPGTTWPNPSGPAGGKCGSLATRRSMLSSSGSERRTGETRDQHHTDS
jgi:hypothetical protein